VKKSWLALVVCTAVALPVVAQEAAVAEKGKMLLASNGARLGAIYRVTPEGAAQIIIDGKMVAVPANTITKVDGKLQTSLSKNEVLALH
jgi:hypothetical protein